jgi:uncharacterized integral membrane protein
MGNYLKVIILVIILLFLITFGVKNSHPIQLSYYFNIPTIDIPLYALAYLSVVIGIFIGMIIGISRRLSLRRAVKSSQREIRELEKRVTEEKEVQEE